VTGDSAGLAGAALSDVSVADVVLAGAAVVGAVVEAAASAGAADVGADGAVVPHAASEAISMMASNPADNLISLFMTNLPLIFFMTNLL